MTAAVPASGSRGVHPSASARLIALAGAEAGGTSAPPATGLSRGRAGAAFLLASAIALAACAACGVLGLLLAVALFGYGGLG